MNENQQFQTIFRFLDNLNGEVSGRMAGRLDPELEARLRSLATGGLDPKSRDLLLEELAGDPVAVSRLAQFLSGDRN
jgi:hypothetical protein